MKAGIFRAAAIERLSTPDRIDQPLRMTGSLEWLALIALAVLIAAALIATVIISVPIKVSGNGILLPTAGILDIPMSDSGRLTEIIAVAGMRVRRGDVVARLAQPELRDDVKRLTADLADLVAERQSVSAFQVRGTADHSRLDAKRRQNLEQSHKLVLQRLVFMRERQASLVDLLAKRTIIRQRVIDGQIELGATEEAAAANDLQLRQLDLDADAARITGERERLNLDLKVANAQRARAALIDRLADAERVVSPYDGVVAEVRHNRGELVAKGVPLLSLLPDSRGSGTAAVPLVVVLFVPAADGKKIRAGMIAEISPSTVRREEFGYIDGRVMSVAAIPSTEEGMLRVLGNHQLVTTLAAGGAPFEVRVELDADPRTVSRYRWSSSTGPATTISSGTLAGGAIRVKQLHLIEIILPFLQRFYV